MKLLTLFTLFIISSAYAVEIDPVTGQIIDKKAKPKNYNINFNTAVSTNLYEFQNKDEKAFSSLSSVAFNYSFPNSYRLFSSLNIAKDFTGERELLVRDSALGLSKFLGKVFARTQLNLVGSITLPFSDFSRQTEGLRTRLRISSTFITDLGHLLDGLRMFISPSYTHSLHKFKTRSTGESNPQHTVGSSLVFGYSFFEKFYFQAFNFYSRNWTYQGKSRDFFSFDQSLNYSLGSGITIYGGHNLGGSALAVNGTNSDVRVFDADESSFYLGVNYTY